MAEFTVDMVQRAAQSFLEYQNGRSLYYKNAVKLTANESFWKGEYKVQADVLDGRTEQVQLQISGDHIAAASCSCAFSRTGQRLCRHGVAAMLSWIKGIAAPVSVVRTSPSGTQLIRAYSERNLAQAVAAGKGELHLEPRLLLNRRKTELTVKIGHDKLYLIQDLAAFTESMHRRELGIYGKSTEVLHDRMLLDETSKGLCDLVTGAVDAVGQNESMRVNGHVRKIKQLLMTPAQIDQFMELYLGQEIPVEAALTGNRKQTLYGYVDRSESGWKRIAEADPRIPILFSQKGTNGVHMELPEELFVFCGEKRVYVSWQDTIYFCSQGYSAAAGLFLDQMMNHMYPDYGMLDLSVSDMPSFCQQVLFQIQNYFEIREVDTQLSSYYPERLMSRFYLDQTEDGMITCRLEHGYGEILWNPLDTDAPVQEHVLRDKAGELQVFHAVSKFFYRDNEQKLFITPDNEAVWRLLSGGIASLQALGEVFAADSVSTIRTLQSSKNRVGVSLEGNLLNLTLDLEEVDPEELAALLDSYRRKKKYHKLKNGDFLNLQDETVGTLAELVDGLGIDEKQLQDGSMSVPAYRALYVEDVMEQNQELPFTRNREFRELIRSMEVQENAASVPDGLEEILRTYQTEGFYWLKRLEQYGFHGILADDMGLGKTLQVIALLRSQPAEAGTTLVVCPSSLIYNWEHEFHRFAPQMRVLPVVGSAEEREALVKNASEYDVLVTSYELLRRDEELYQTMEFHYMILDEAQYIKNHTTLNARTVKQIPARHRIALTGTPIENRLSELWSIFDFLMPGFLYPYSRFREEFETPIVKNQDEKVLERFRRLTRPFILRRLKKDVLQDLPGKTEEVVMSALDGQQKQLYQASVLQIRQMLQTQSTEEYKKNQMQILSQLLRLRQICCDPRLCFEQYRYSSAKLDTCMELVQSSVASGHKLLLFSQFTSMLALIEERLQMAGIGYYKLTGSTSKEERQQLVSAFQTDETPVFLISLKAGGTGLNLTAADIVIHYDPWWNVAAQNQATDRTHRIGQEHPVTVYKLIARDTIEERVLDLQNRKKALSEQVLEGLEDSLSHLSREELLDILH